MLCGKTQPSTAAVCRFAGRISFVWSPCEKLKGMLCADAPAFTLSWYWHKKPFLQQHVFSVGISWLYFSPSAPSVSELFGLFSFLAACFCRCAFHFCTVKDSWCDTDKFAVNTFYVTLSYCEGRQFSLMARPCPTKTMLSPFFPLKLLLKLHLRQCREPFGAVSACCVVFLVQHSAGSSESLPMCKHQGVQKCLSTH